MDSPLGVPGELEQAVPGQALHSGMMLLCFYLESRIRLISFTIHYLCAEHWFMTVLHNNSLLASNCQCIRGRVALLKHKFV
jgi:hypothetical protein